MSATSLALPTILVEVNRSPLPDAERGALAEIRVSQKLSRPAQCELVLLEQPGGSLSSRWAPGSPLRVSAGTGLPALFEGEITALEYVYDFAAGRQLRVRGYDRMHRLRKRQPVRAHIDVRLTDLLQELVGPVGLTVASSPVTLSWRRLIQHGQTDLQLLTDLTEASGLSFVLRGDTLHLITLEGLGEPVPLLLGESLLEARIEINGDPSCRTVAAGGWDPARAQAHEGRADHARAGRVVAAEILPEQVGGTQQRTLVHAALQDDSHAEALAQAELDMRVAREVVLRGLAEGDPRLQPGARIQVQGVAAAVEGRYVLTEVTHLLNGQQGFVSEISTYPAAPEPRPRGSSVVLGKVTSVDDPQHLGRVQVTLTACQNVESDWMNVVTVGAGAKKGFIMLPDVGDTVLVLCPEEDPAQGVVLGGLYGADGPPDGGIEDRSVKRFTCLTPGGQRLRFDDGKKSVRLENADGSFLELGLERVVFHSERDVSIEAPGRTMTLKAKAINFEQG